MNNKVNYNLNKQIKLSCEIIIVKKLKNSAQGDFNKKSESQAIEHKCSIVKVNL